VTTGESKKIGDSENLDVVGDSIANPAPIRLGFAVGTSGVAREMMSST
jgi:hypothetical protein